jgi:multidrug efflux pump subunit AcrA (membrane-fusion protein)
VWIVSDDAASKRAIQVGAIIGERIEITSGINVGDKVVVRGAERLSGDNAKVRVTE